MPIIYLVFYVNFAPLFRRDFICHVEYKTLKLF